MKKMKTWLIAVLMIAMLAFTSCDLLGPIFGFDGFLPETDTPVVPDPEPEGPAEPDPDKPTEPDPDKPTEPDPDKPETPDTEVKETVILKEYVTKSQPSKMPSTSEKDMKVNNVRLGDPSWLSPEAAMDEDFRIERNSYNLSYNNTTHLPNWVSWHIDPTHVGKEDRPSGFKKDPLLPKDWDRVEDGDYTNSGFDRGHMCPNADRNGNIDMQNETFYMTNIVPQSHANNGGPWKDLEGHIQSKVEKGSEAYVVSGTWGIGGEGKLKDGTMVKRDEIVSGPDKYGHSMTIQVPAYTWKVAIVMENSTNDISRINSGRGIEPIAVLIPNVTDGISSNHFEDYVVSIDFIEGLTGYDFFANIDNSTENALEKKNSGSSAEMVFRTNYNVIEP